MEIFIKKITELLLLGGTAGGYAVMAVILLIVGYFKYLKPFLSDFYKLNSYITERIPKTYDEINRNIDELEDKLDKVLQVVEKKKVGLSEMITDQHQENHQEIKEIVTEINRDIKIVLEDMHKREFSREQFKSTILEKLIQIQTKIDMLAPMDRSLQGVRK